MCYVSLSDVTSGGQVVGEEDANPLMVLRAEQPVRIPRVAHHEHISLQEHSVIHSVHINPTPLFVCRCAHLTARDGECKQQPPIYLAS